MLRFETLLFDGEDNALRHQMTSCQPISDDQRGFMSEQVIDRAKGQYVLK